MSITPNQQANFTPTLKGYTGQAPFKFWCQTVLPLVYDDSLSYYELLNKVVNYLNNVISDVANVEDNVNGLHDAYVSLQNYVNDYFSSLDVQEEINNKLDEMVSDGTLPAIVARLSAGRVNVASFVEGELTSENIESGIRAALNVSEYIYIPAGDYKFSMTIENRNCDILLSSDAIFRHGDSSAEQKAVFIFNNCSVKIHGGQFTSDIYVESRTLVGLEWNGIIELHNCYNCVLENIKGYNSKMGSIITLENTTNTIVRLCSFDGFILSAIHIIYTCRSISVTHCTFKNAYIKSGSYYCYFVYTGVRSISETNVIMPPDNIEYSYNLCENSEDCGLDTHGATNVTICNNTILNTSVAITAYNDAGRVQRPAGWLMRNITIRNNYCESTSFNSSHAVPYVFLFHDVNQSAIDIENVEIANNYFSNTAHRVFLAECCRNVQVINNTFIGEQNNEFAIIVYMCENIVFIGNSFSGGTSANVRVSQATGIFKNNIGDNSNKVLLVTQNSYSNIEGASEYAKTRVSRMVRFGDAYYVNDRAKLVTSFVPRPIDGSYNIAPLSGELVDGVFTSSAQVRFVTNQEITLDDTYICRVVNLINKYSFTVAGNLPANGSYTAVALTAETYDITNPNIGKVVSAEVEANTYREAGCYLSFGKMADTPVPDDTEITELHVAELGRGYIRQVVFGTLSTTFWVRIMTSGYTGVWYSYTH